MITDKDGRVLTSQDLMRIRTAAVGQPALSAVARKVACGANQTVARNFLLRGGRCCFCGVDRAAHKVA